MNDSQAKDAQMTQVEEATMDLQMRLTYQDDEIKQINRALVRQQAHLAAMTQEISRLRELVSARETSRVGGRIQEEPPPHY